MACKPYRRVDVRETEIPPRNPANRISARYSHYDPRLGGANCYNFVGGECVSLMASGYGWREYFGVAVACPAEFDFGTIFVLDGKEWVCLDRGGMIETLNDGTIWLDFLTDSPEYDYGELVEAEIR